MQEKDREDQLDRLFGKHKVSHGVKEERNVPHNIKKNEAYLDWSRVRYELPSEIRY
jgi:hypothetical protein